MLSIFVYKIKTLLHKERSQVCTENMFCSSLPHLVCVITKSFVLIFQLDLTDLISQIYCNSNNHTNFDTLHLVVDSNV